MIKVLSYYPATIRLHDDTTGAAEDIRLRIKRLTMEEFIAFSRDYRRVSDPPSERIFARQPGPEQEKTEQGDYVISDAEVRERRLRAMSAEERAAWEIQDQNDEAFAREFLLRSISDYVTVEPGQIQDEAGRELTTGADLIRLFVARGDVIQQLVRLIWTENTLSPDQKKVLRSLFAFQHSLSAALPEVLGNAQELTAALADKKASAASEDALSQAMLPFGSTEKTSSDTPAPSSI